MNMQDLMDAMGRIAPLEFAEPWDKVGLQVGSTDHRLSGPVLLTIDLTAPVVEEAVAHGASAVIAYHPLIWNPLASLTSEDAKGQTILRLISNGIAVYSPHTAIDAVPGGVTDWLCEGLSGGKPGKVRGDCRAIQAHEQRWSSRAVKLVTFVPADKVDTLRNAIATAGAGRIGGYELCSFASEGTGTFLATESTNPAVGTPGQLQRVEEVRLEMVCSRPGLALAVETLRQFHPYEEPAIDVYELEPQPVRTTGVGRKLVLDQPVTLRELADRLKQHLDRARVRVAGTRSVDEPVTSLGVVPGAGGDFFEAARSQSCEVFVTGEMKHHEILAAVNRGVSVLLAGHTNTERGYLPRLAMKLREHLPGVDVIVSETDGDILQVL